MSSIQFLGNYLLSTSTLSISLCKKEWIDESQIKNICFHLSKNNIDDLTIELTTNSFINFRKDKEEIRFIGGPLSEYGYLHNSLSTLSLTSNNVIVEETIIGQNPEQSVAIDQGVLNESALIHNSLLPPLEQFEIAFQKAEIFFKPYESPGGDFYWIKNYQHKSIIIVGDCTGHGIQGAMIAMSVITLLKQYFKLLPPASMRTAIIEFYENLQDIMEEQDTDLFDVEIGIILKDHKSNTVEYMGSGINLIVKNEEGCIPYTSRKVRVMNGKQTSSKFELKKGNQLFLFSDGITDQFNAANERKLGMKALVSLIESISNEVSMEEFKENFGAFSGTTESLDDQTLLLLTI